MWFYESTLLPIVLKKIHVCYEARQKVRVDKRMYREKSGKFPRDIAISKKPLGFCVAHMLQDQGFFSWHLSRTLTTIVDFFRIFDDFLFANSKDVVLEGI